MNSKTNEIDNLKKTLVLGASTKPERFAYKAISLLRKKGIEVVAIGNRSGEVADVEIVTEKIHFENIHTVTLYLNAANQQQYIDFILSLEPKRIIFNPGTENIKLKSLAKELGIEVVENCTLVMLNSGIY